MNVNALQRKFERLQDQAARRRDQSRPIEYTTCWGDEDQVPGVTYIITDWSSGPLPERGDQLPGPDDCTT